MPGRILSGEWHDHIYLLESQPGSNVEKNMKGKELI